MKYRTTYIVPMSISVEIDVESDEATTEEERSVELINEFLDTLPGGSGPHHLIADASIDGVSPSRIVRIHDSVTIHEEKS